VLRIVVIQPVSVLQTEQRVLRGVKVSDIVAENNLKHAWQFVLDTLDYQMDYQ